MHTSKTALCPSILEHTLSFLTFVTRAFSFLRCRFLYFFFTDDLWVFQFLSTSTHLLWLVSSFSTMAYSMAHLAAGSLCLLEPSGHARAGSGVTCTTSVSALGIGSWVSFHTTYPERRGQGRPPPLPPPRPPFAYCQSSFFFSTPIYSDKVPIYIKKRTSKTRDESSGDGPWREIHSDLASTNFNPPPKFSDILPIYSRQVRSTSGR